MCMACRKHEATWLCIYPTLDLLKCNICLLKMWTLTKKYQTEGPLRIERICDVQNAAYRRR